MRYTHTNIVAKDWKHLSEFYINVFGCAVKPPERKLSGSWLDCATGLSGARLEGVHLLLPGYGASGPTLEIFSYDRMEESETIMANTVGLTHLAFEVESVDDTFELAMENGAEPLGRITTKEIQGVGVLKFVYIRDPEGNIVEIQSWEN